MDIVIRKIDKSDKDIYFALSDEFYSSGAVLHKIPVKNMETTFRYVTENSPYADCFIFEWEGQPAGYGLLAITYTNEAGGEVVWLEEIYIRTEFRSKGIGRKFIAFVEDHYKDRAARIRLEVEKDNHRAADLYKTLGYNVLPYLQMYKDFQSLN